MFQIEATLAKLHWSLLTVLSCIILLNVVLSNKDRMIYPCANITLRRIRQRHDQIIQHRGV